MRRPLKILLSLFLALLLFWFAFSQVDLGEFLSELANVSLAWVVPFCVAVFAGHYLRAERWKLLLRESPPPRTTLFAGVMLGYMANYLLPRLGEISRPVYVARKQGTGSGGLFGTIVVERVFDMISLGAVLALVIWLFSRDTAVMEQMLGSGDWSARVLLLTPFILLAGMLLLWGAIRWLRCRRKWLETLHPSVASIFRFAIQFWEGFVSIRKVKQWPLFLLYTVGIWLAYTLMTYFPFAMLDLHSTFDLGLREAMVITVFSAVGVSIPTPGGVGSYHLLVQQSLWLLYSVPLSMALTYATVTHAVNLLVVVLIGAFSLWIDKRNTLGKGFER